jgi:pimeloyl-ACP methyl ester carboxylesterase
LYPADVLGNGLSSMGTAYEADVVKTWAPQDFPQLAAQIGAPVQFLAGDHESVWESDDDALAAIAGMFSAAPRVEVGVLADSGHNLSVGHTAATYHLKVLTFADECVASPARTDMEVEAG